MVDIKESVLNELYRIRAFKESDASSLSTELNNKAVANTMTMDLPWSVEKAKWWISYINNVATKLPLQELHFAIEIDNKLVGSVGLINIKDHRCEIGYWMAKSYQNKGVMTKAINQIVTKSSKTLGILRFFAPILPHNKASACVLEKNGFQMEGVLKKYYLKQGKYIDAHCYAWVR